MLKKGIDVSFKDIDLPKGIVSGYFSQFGTVDSDGDIIEKGAFSKSIKERGPSSKKLIKHLLDHKRDWAVGVIQVLKEDDFGLYYESKVGSHANGRDFLLMVESEIINQHSIGYQVVKYNQDNDKKTTRLTEIKLLEGSSLQFLGANENTPIVGIKSVKEAMEHAFLLEKFIHNSTATDETLQELGQKLKSLINQLEPLMHSSEEDEPMDNKSIYSLLAN